MSIFMATDRLLGISQTFRLFIWKTLNHAHIVAFLSISTRSLVFEVCDVIVLSGLESQTLSAPLSPHFYKTHYYDYHGCAVLTGPRATLSFTGS